MIKLLFENKLSIQLDFFDKKIYYNKKKIMKFKKICL
jgi:hypothetical protein